MQVVPRLRPELIAIAPGWRGFREAVTGLVALGVAADAVPPARAGEAVRALVAREEEASTAILDIGVGMPHARLPGLARTVVALAAARAGLYEPVPTIAVQIVGLVLSPLAAIDEHLQVLANLATLLRSPALREALLDAADGGAALAALERHARTGPV